jgi:DNA repair protein RadC
VHWALQRQSRRNTGTQIMTTQNIVSDVVRMYHADSARQRLLQLGAAALSDAELVGLVLPAMGGQCRHTKAAELLTSFGSIRRLLSADRNDAREHGLNDGAYAALQAAMELTRRHYGELMEAGPMLTNPRSTREYLRMRFRDLPHEVFAILYLDNRNRVIALEELFRGTIDGATVHPREVVKRALYHNAAALILAHNHPSGVAEPSQADELITRRLKEALSTVDIRVLDHLVIGDGVCESMAERGLL